MELEVKKIMELVSVPDDMYRASISAIKEAEYEYGEVLIISFRIKEGQYAGKEVNGLCKALINPRSKLYDWITALGFKVVEGGIFNTKTMLGKECRILTKQRLLSKPTDETPEKVSNVDKVYAL